MRLVLRRAVRAWGLLLAIAASALVATAAVTLLAGYDREVGEAGWRSIAATAPPAERSLLITGSVPGDAAAFAERDAAVRARFAGGLGGVPTSTTVARYGTGRQLLGDLVPVRASRDPVFAALATLDHLSDHATLTAGAWPRPGRTPLEVSLPQRAATTLGVGAGARIAVRDRATGRDSAVVVTGTWRPTTDSDPYWLLSPELTTGSATSFGPFVLDGADFARTFTGTATSVRWVVEPALTTAGLGGVAAAGRALDRTVRDLPEKTGLGDSAVVTTELGGLASRITRANAVGRSSMLIPLALVVILGIGVLVRVAALLNEDRGEQITLLRARGASRRQLAGLAAGEAALTVSWAAVLAPAPALLVMDRLDLHPHLDPVLWLVACVVAAGCLIAMLGPAVLASPEPRSRRWAPARRAGVDVVLVALAVLAWTQARQYSSAAGDPSLPAAPVLGVLAGSVLALRVLPLLTAALQRVFDRPRWPAATFGGWQAGRRPHAARMLVLALAVGSGTLAWTMLATVDRSHADQAAYEVGADLRLQDTAGAAARATRLAALPGVRSVTPGWRDDVRMGTDNTPITVLAAAGVAPTADRTGVALPAGARTLSGVLRTSVAGARVTCLITTAGGLTYPVPLTPGAFSVGLPPGQQLRIAGFDAGTGRPVTGFDLAVTGLRVDGAPLDLRGPLWTMMAGDDRGAARPSRTGELRARLRLTFRTTEGAVTRFTVAAQRPDRPVPAVVTPQVLTALGAKVSDTIPLSLPGADFPVQVVGVRADLPGGTGPAAILVDLPAAADRLLADNGTVRPYSQWLLGTDPGRHADAAAAAGALPGISVLDRVVVQRAADHDPYWRGVRTGLLTAVVSVVVLALVGCLVDMWVSLRRRAGEVAVLRRLGAGSGLLNRAFLIEQGLVAGAGSLAGLAAGLAAAALTVPLAVLTPAGARPVPEPALVLPWWPIAVLAAGLPAAILVAGWAVAARDITGRAITGRAVIGRAVTGRGQS